VTRAAGFRYAWDEQTKQFAHPAGVIVLTPDGRPARYLFGVEYGPRDLRLALVEASTGRIGSAVDALLLYCYHYDPMTGRYGLVVMRLLRIAGLGTVLARGYDDGTDLSGGQWQRVALARALTAVRQGARIVLLDEPTAALDVRGEAEIFDRILTETRGCTTILVSHRFSTVRQADLICVLEHGAVVELGTHAELMALGGRYRTMFELQASRFTEYDELGEEVVHESLD